MRSKLVITGLASIAAALLGMTSCSSTGGSDQSASGAAPVGGETLLPKPLAEAQKSALHALSSIGAEVKKSEPTYLEGRRPNKMGLVVGSGGETVKIWLAAQGPAKTSVKVKTEKSLVGIAGQKNWDDSIIAAMR